MLTSCGYLDIPMDKRWWGIEFLCPQRNTDFLVIVLQGNLRHEPTLRNSQLVDYSN